MESQGRKSQRRTASGRTPEPANKARGIVVAPLATAAALDASAFAKIDADDLTIPAAWEDRAKKDWEYYVEEPLVKNCINSRRTFAVGDEIRTNTSEHARYPLTSCLNGGNSSLVMNTNSANKKGRIPGDRLSGSEVWH